MSGPLTTRAVLLQLLREGPRYGAELCQRFKKLTDGRVRLAPGRVYPVLKELEGKGILRAFRVVPRGRRGGRARIYYDLTPRGLKASTKERGMLLALLSPALSSRPSGRERARMSARLIDTDELSASGAELAGAKR